MRSDPVVTSDAELIDRARRGDATAFETIMRRHNRLLFRSARGIIGDDAEAQDVVQEAYLRAFCNLDSFRGDAALATWLTRITINAALDTLRKRGRAPAMHDTPPDSAEEGMNDLNGTGGSSGRADSPDSLCERRELCVLLQDAIDKLPPIYRSVFMLRAVEEMSVEQVADCLQISRGTVRVRYLRARALLRDAIGARVESVTDRVYCFDGQRCDALVDAVLRQLRCNAGAIGAGEIEPLRDD